MKVGSKVWRESASLIVLARNSCASRSNSADHHNNYKVLTFKRPQSSSFMPNAIVFPGGGTEPADETHEWLDHFKNCGVSENKLTELVPKVDDADTRPSIFYSFGLSALRKEVSLRITAIRETFEELGILICRRKGQIESDDDFGGFVEDFNRAKWQKLIHDDPKQFLCLCEEHELIPDIWRLYEWSVWLTPVELQRRFKTAFFLVSLPEQPQLLPEKTEVLQAVWETPANLLSSLRSATINLATPQAYELTRISKYKNIEALTKFAKIRSNLGTTLQYPMLYLCSEGVIIVFPGDHLYPENPNLDTADYDAFQYADRNFLELRQMSVRMHRCEQRSVHNVTFILNFDLPNGHIGPMAKL